MVFCVLLVKRQDDNMLYCGLRSYKIIQNIPCRQSHYVFTFFASSLSLSVFVALVAALHESYALHLSS